MAAGRWVGRGDKEGGDGAAVDAIRELVNSVSMRGVVTGPSSRATTREILPFAAVEVAAMFDLPPLDA